MPLRSYDPTIARWNRIDPIVHHGLSTYNAFDNNPVFYNDPSGGNSNNHSTEGATSQPLRNDREMWQLDHDFAVNGIHVTPHRGPQTTANSGWDYAAAASAGMLDNNSDIRRNYGSGLAGLNAALAQFGLSASASTKKPYKTPDFLGISTELDEVLIRSNPKDDIRAYEENDRIMVRNSMVLDVLSKLTNTGQIKNLTVLIIEEWRVSTGIVVKRTEAEQMIADIDEAFTELGVTVTTAVPQVKIAATVIATPLMADNTYRDFMNNQVYGPRIRKHSEHYYHHNIQSIPYYDVGGPGPYSSGGGGAGGGW